MSKPDYPLVYPDETQARMISHVASSVAHRFHPDVLKEDIAQEIYLKWALDWKYLQHYVYDENEARGAAMLRKALTNAAVVYCVAEKAAMRGYQPSDLHFYSKQSLREILPFLDDTEAFTSLAVKSERVGRSNKPAHEGGDAMAMVSDIRRVWPLLTQPQRDMLWYVFVEPASDAPYATLGAQWEVTDEAAYMRVDRALGALQGLLGGPRPVERRKIVSNAQSQAMTRSDYGGE